MPGLEVWHKTKAFRLISLGVLVHVSLFFGALDVYFSSPVEFGLTSFKTNFSLADRVVVFIADGLRYETLEDINFDGYTPFLNKIRRNYGVWGVSYTRVPTESRPGHVALFGGMYEDPSAILSGWKRNPVNVDNVFNQSVESWLWGSPDIVPMFNKDNLNKINTYYYDSSFEDFSGRRSTIELDKWVFDRVKDYLYRNPIERFEGGGKIFLLHLLGMDTVGHVFKPNSQEYIDNLKYVDAEIRKMYGLFETFFKDSKTSYIFTSDHGMTDWGSHGSGSDHETRSPFIAWGSGMRIDKMSCYLHQADIAPLISALLGINIPTNSVGLVPYKYLNTNPKQETLILYVNMRQLGERFNRRHDRIERATAYGFFKPFSGLNENIFREKIRQIQIKINWGLYEIAKQDILELIELIQDGDKYIDRHYKYPLLFALSLGLILWMIYLLLYMIHYPQNRNKTTAVSNNFRVRCLTNYIIILIGFAIALQYHQIQRKYQFYLFFPCLTLLPLIIELNQVIYLFKYLWNVFKLQFLLKISYCGLGLASMIFSLYYEFYIIVPVALLALWGLSMRKYCEMKDILLWIILPILVCYYPIFLKIAKNFSALQTIMSYFIASCVVVIKIKNLSNQVAPKIKSKMRIYCYILKIYFVLLTAAFLTAMVYIISGITAGNLQKTICAVSWSVLCLTIILAAISHGSSINRALDISILFLIIYMMTSTSGESLFLVLFIALQFQWVSLETHKFKVRRSRNKDQRNAKNQASFDDFRRCMFFIYFILLSYFGAGNTADVNTFDPIVNSVLSMGEPLNNFVVEKCCSLNWDWEFYQANDKKCKSECTHHIISCSNCDIKDDFLERSGSSKIIETQKTPHSVKHKTHRKFKKSEHSTIPSTLKRERSTPSPIIKFSNYEEVWNNMVNKEEVTKKSRNSKIFADRTTYLPRMRAILLDWIMEVCEVYRLRRTTYYLAVDYIDRYLTLKPAVPKTQLQLLGVSCLFIAAKLEEIYPPKLSEFSYVCDGACTETEILACEILLLNTLQWDVNPMTPTTWLNLYLQIYCSNDFKKSQIEIRNQTSFHFPQYSAYQFVRASHLIDLFSMDPGFLRFSYSIIAAGAMYYIFGKEVAESVSGYQWKRLEACIEYMSVFNQLINDSKDSRLQSVCTQDIDDSLLGNFRFLKKKISTLVKDESHCMQTHVVDLDFFERSTLLRLEKLGMRVEKTLVKRKKKITDILNTPEKLNDDQVDNDEKNTDTDLKCNENENLANGEETTIVMYEIEKILDEQVNKCLDIFNIPDETNESVCEAATPKADESSQIESDENKVVNILKIDKKTKLSFDDILSSMHNDYYEEKYK
ncbi:hypothetical protein Trydic_g5086 [Trypoxylus dichotomus]